MMSQGLFCDFLVFFFNLNQALLNLIFLPGLLFGVAVPELFADVGSIFGCNLQP
jgi:hypothetical protein